MKQQVKSIQTVISESPNKLLFAIMNWSEIVGKNNAEITIPIRLKQKILEIAVPNNIVLATVSKFSRLIIDRMNAKTGGENVLRLKFSIVPSLFNKTKKIEKKRVVQKTTDFPEEEISQKKLELMQKFGFDETTAENAANIEMFITKNKKSNKPEI